jgi:repressor LexA
MFTRDKDRRQKILDFIRQYTEEHGFPPSVREIGRAVGIRSTRAVKYHLDILVQQGTLERAANKARSVTTGSSAYALPLVGRIAAGSPVLAVENIESQVSLSRFRDCFLLRVHGDSMTGAGIIDGDMVIVRQQEGARNGEIVAAMIGDEATVKRFERRKDRITLYPENPDFKPIVVRKDQGEFHIIGAVVGLLRNYR